MTQKELLYVEDAIGHEKNIISICESMIPILDDDTLINFLESEIKKHQNMEKKLTKLLEGMCDE